MAVKIHTLFTIFSTRLVASSSRKRAESRRFGENRRNFPAFHEMRFPGRDTGIRDHVQGLLYKHDAGRVGANHG
jgi:hypothetical protein